MIHIRIEVPKLKKPIIDINKYVIVGLRKGMLYVRDKVKEGFGKSGRPKVRTGALKNSISSDAKQESSNVFVGTLRSGTPYGAIHEYGGIIKPKNGPYLKFQIKGKWKTVRQVVMPARPYLRPELELGVPKIRDLVTEEIVKGATI